MFNSDLKERSEARVMKREKNFNILLILFIFLVFILLINVSFISASQKYTLKVTEEHPFFVLNNMNGIWKTAKELRVGDELLTEDGKKAKITSVKSIDEEAGVYNLNVDYVNTYFANNVLVHNKPVPYNPEGEFTLYLIKTGEEPGLVIKNMLEAQRVFSPSLRQSLLSLIRDIKNKLNEPEKTLENKLESLRKLLSIDSGETSEKMNARVRYNSEDGSVEIIFPDNFQRIPGKTIAFKFALSEPEIYRYDLFRIDKAKPCAEEKGLVSIFKPEGIPNAYSIFRTAESGISREALGSKIKEEVKIAIIRRLVSDALTKEIRFGKSINADALIEMMGNINPETIISTVEKLFPGIDTKNLDANSITEAIKSIDLNTIMKVVKKLNPELDFLITTETTPSGKEIKMMNALRTNSEGFKVEATFETLYKAVINGISNMDSVLQKIKLNENQFPADFCYKSDIGVVIFEYPAESGIFKILNLETNEVDNFCFSGFELTVSGKVNFAWGSAIENFDPETKLIWVFEIQPLKDNPKLSRISLEGIYPSLIFDENLPLLKYRISERPPGNRGLVLYQNGEGKWRVLDRSIGESMIYSPEDFPEQRLFRDKDGKIVRFNPDKPGEAPKIEQGPVTDSTKAYVVNPLWDRTLLGEYQGQPYLTLYLLWKNGEMIFFDPRNPYMPVKEATEPFIFRFSDGRVIFFDPRPKKFESIDNPLEVIEGRVAYERVDVKIDEQGKKATEKNLYIFDPAKPNEPALKVAKPMTIVNIFGTLIVVDPTTRGKGIPVVEEIVVSKSGKSLFIFNPEKPNNPQLIQGTINDGIEKYGFTPDRHLVIRNKAKDAQRIFNAFLTSSGSYRVRPLGDSAENLWDYVPAKFKKAELEMRDVYGNKISYGELMLKFASNEFSLTASGKLDLTGREVVSAMLSISDNEGLLWYGNVKLVKSKNGKAWFILDSDGNQFIVSDCMMGEGNPLMIINPATNKKIGDGFIAPNYFDRIPREYAARMFMPQVFSQDRNPMLFFNEKTLMSVEPILKKSAEPVGELQPKVKPVMSAWAKKVEKARKLLPEPAEDDKGKITDMWVSTEITPEIATFIRIKIDPFSDKGVLETIVVDLGKENEEPKILSDVVTSID
jgi:hypothetical protein